MAKTTMGISEKQPHNYLGVSRLTSEGLLSSNDDLDSSGEVSNSWATNWLLWLEVLPTDSAH